MGQEKLDWYVELLCEPFRVTPRRTHPPCLPPDDAWLRDANLLGELACREHPLFAKHTNRVADGPVRGSTRAVVTEC